MSFISLLYQLIINSIVHFYYRWIPSSFPLFSLILFVFHIFIVRFHSLFYFKFYHRFIVFHFNFTIHPFHSISAFLIFRLFRSIFIPFSGTIPFSIFILCNICSSPDFHSRIPFFYCSGLFHSRIPYFNVLLPIFPLLFGTVPFLISTFSIARYHSIPDFHIFLLLGIVPIPHPIYSLLGTAPFPYPIFSLFRTVPFVFSTFFTVLDCSIPDFHIFHCSGPFHSHIPLFSCSGPFHFPFPFFHCSGPFHSRFPFFLLFGTDPFPYPIFHCWRPFHPRIPFFRCSGPFHSSFSIFLLFRTVPFPILNFFIVRDRFIPLSHFFYCSGPIYSRIPFFHCSGLLHSRIPFF